jgi:osmoprotectant transport system permease protein
VAELDWDWLNRNWDDVAEYTVQHIQLVGVSMGIAVAVAVPIGVLVRRSNLMYGAATGVSALLYTIPSLALFGVLVPIVGIGALPVIIGLVMYSLLIIIRNTVVGLRSVPDPVRQAATGMGLTRGQVLRTVELPLALPSIMAGIRLATVSAVGIATIGVLVGAGGLGELIYNDGINRANPRVIAILAGAVIATLMAIILDVLLYAAEWALKPWARARAGR